MQALTFSYDFSASAVRCPPLRKASIAMRWRANAVSSHVATAWSSLILVGKWVMHSCSHSGRLTR